MKSFKQFLKEKNNTMYKRTCLMADVPKYLSIPGVDYDVDGPEEVDKNKVYNSYLNFVDKFVKPEDIYDDDGTKGKESSPHITILYGSYIHNAEKDLATINRLVKQINPFKVTLGKVDKFRQDNYDVLKINVIPNIQLKSFHALIKNNIENDYEYEGYKPHITLCYLNPGACEELVGDDTFEGIEFTIDRLDFSMGDGTLKSVYIPYNKVDVKNIVEDVIDVIPVIKPLKEDGDGGGSGGGDSGDGSSGPSTTTPTTIATGLSPNTTIRLKRNGKSGKKFKEVYKGFGGVYSMGNQSIYDPSSGYGTGDSGAVN